MSRFVVYARPLVEKDICDAFFLTTAGKSISSLHLSERAKAYYKKPTGLEKIFNFTIGRMSLTTAVRQTFSDDPHTSQILAKMTHEEFIASRFYYIANNTQAQTKDIHEKIMVAFGMKVNII